jgi:hypothetical protein
MMLKKRLGLRERKLQEDDEKFRAGSFIILNNIRQMRINTAYTGQMRHVWRTLLEKPEGKKRLRRTKRR